MPEQIMFEKFAQSPQLALTKQIRTISCGLYEVVSIIAW